jgi:hypothetical protein
MLFAMTALYDVPGKSLLCKEHEMIMVIAGSRVNLNLLLKE